MNLDGETNLKPKTIASIPLQTQIKNNNEESTDDHNDSFKESEQPGEHPKYKKYINNLCEVSGTIECSMPSENLEKWEGEIKMDNLQGEDKQFFCNIDNLLLRGCYLRNIEYVYGIAVYLGQETKIMMNAKKPPRKVSNLMKLMNYMLYTVFALQFLIIILFASLSIDWISRKGEDYEYLDLDDDSSGVGNWFIQLLTYWVAYSHMIPISLYVMIEVLKLTQATLIKWDQEISEEDTGGKSAECKNSDLIEELGQVDFIFSDKTGTLTCNQMIFRKCSVGRKIYVDKSSVSIDDRNKDNNVSMPNHTGEHRLMDNDYEDFYWEDVATQNDPSLEKFFKHMTICHSVMVENVGNKEDEENVRSYEESKQNKLDLKYQ